MTRKCASALLLFAVAVATNQLSGQRPNQDEDAAIKILIQEREAAWNNGDVEAYRRLLTSDADLLSGTGRIASGKEAILALYSEQRAGVYKGATTSTPIESIRFLRDDVALVNTRSQVTGLRSQGASLPLRDGRQTLVVTKEQGRWMIAAFRSCASSSQSH